MSQRCGWVALLVAAVGVANAANAASPAHGAPAPAPAAARAPRFTFYGLAPALAGFDLARAEAALGQPLTLEPGPLRRTAAGATAGASAPGPACQYRAVAAQPGVRYALSGGVITRVETRDARWRTLSGMRVGSTLAQARRAYRKRLMVAPHPYFAQGHTLLVYSPDRRFALVMEANDEGRIITLRGGRLPEVAWLEGC